MKKSFFYTILTLLMACNSDDTDKCDLVICLGGDTLEIVLTSNNENILDTNSQSNISITQNNIPIEFQITPDNSILFFLEDLSTVQINANDTEFNMLMSSILIEGECCNNSRIDTIVVNGTDICTNDELCDEILEISID